MNRKIKIIIHILCSILLFVACSKSEQTGQLLTQADSIIYSYTDSAISILDKVADSKFSDREKADYWRLRTTSHIVQGKSTVEDSSIISSLCYYRRLDKQKELKDTYRLVINHLYWKGDTVNYRYYMTEAKELAKNANDSLFSYIIYRSIANDFYNEKEYVKSYQYYKKAMTYNNSYPSTYYMAALAYSQVNNNDTIDYWMQKAITLAKQQKDTFKVEHYYRNYADIQISLNMYDKALINIQNMEKYNISSFSVAPYMRAQIFFQQHQLDSAQYYLDRMIEQHSGSDDKRSFIFTKNGLAVFQSMITYAKGGAFNFQSIGNYTDSQDLATSNRIKRIEEQMTVKQKLFKHNMELTIAKQRTVLYLAILIIIILLSSLLTYLYIKRKKEKLLQMKEKTESLLDLLADVSDNLKYNRENNLYFKKVLLQQLGIIRFTASNPTNQNQEMLQHMAKITNDEIPVDSLIVWDDLYALINSLYDGFHSKIKNTFGELLNEREVQLCCLLCASFTTKEISVITQQSTRTIYQRKTIIREKLSMPQGEDIINFISK
jgi:tetratricopeptide (TPR) repeat protein